MIEAWIGFSFVVGIVAAIRGHNIITWTLFSMVFTPLAGIIIVLAMKPDTGRTHINCPDCAEPVLKQALVCKHCGKQLTPSAKAK